MYIHTAQNIPANPKNMVLMLRGSVGRYGDNYPDDVINVQSRLNELLGPPRKRLELSGKADAAVIGAIIDFQANIVGMRRPDGRVDVGKRTARKMSDPNAAGIWRRSPVPREAAPQFLAREIAQDAKLAPGEFLVVKEASKTGEDQLLEELRRELIDSAIPEIKKFLGAIGRADEARVLVVAWSRLRKFGYSTDETSQIIRRILSLTNPKRSWKGLEAIASPTSGFSRLLARAGSIAGTVGQILTIIEVADKFADGDYLYGTTELYKHIVGKRLPWANLIEGLQSLTEALLPKSMKNSEVFKVLRACDPLGLGASGVDFLTTGAIAIVERVVAGEWDRARWNRLSARLEQGPTRFFAEIGKDLGDSVYEMSRWRRDDWSYAVNVFSKLLIDHERKLRIDHQR